MGVCVCVCVSVCVCELYSAVRYCVLTATVFLSHPVAPTITTSFEVAADPCLGFSFIQQDVPPVILTVNVSADPCPTPVWTLDGGGIPASGVTVCYHTCLLFCLRKFFVKIQCLLYVCYCRAPYHKVR